MSAGDGLSLTPLTAIEMRSIRFAKRPLWQLGAFHLLAARKGAGKGTYLAWLAARVTRGELDDATPRHVIYVAASEDSLEIDLKPRLMAAGADPRRVSVIRQHIKLPDDIDAIEELACGCNGLGMLAIDPVANHVGARNTDRDGEVRDAIARLNQLADALDVVLVGVRNVTAKDASRGALASVLGSSAWVDVPRAVLVIAQDDDESDVRHIQVVAGNRTPSGAAETFRIEAADVDGLAEPVTRCVPLGESRKDVDDLLVSSKGRAGSKSTAARELILDVLEGEGDQESDALDARVASETGLTAKTVRNLRSKLADAGLVKARPEKDETGAITRWMIGRTQAERP
jgi:DNA-binding transcriptional ArsR family regulator